MDASLGNLPRPIFLWQTRIIVKAASLGMRVRRVSRRYCPIALQNEVWNMHVPYRAFVRRHLAQVFDCVNGYFNFDGFFIFYV